MTISLKKQVEKAQTAHRRATDAVYAMAPNDQTPFSVCLLHAAGPIASAYEAAKLELWQSEYDAIAKGKAWRGTLGQLNWYR